MFTISLIEPQIPPNTGNIARLCGATDCDLDVVGKIGFELTDKRLKRAGLDYWNHVRWRYVEKVAEYIGSLQPERMHLFSKKAEIAHWDAEYAPGDFLLFGSETTGLPEELLHRFPKRCRRIPMANTNIRSLNLSSAAAIVLYEALRQNKNND